MDNYPVGMSQCDHNGIMGLCGENCPALESGDYVRFEDECYPYEKYLVIKNTRHMSAFKHLVVDEE